MFWRLWSWNRLFPRRWGCRALMCHQESTSSSALRIHLSISAILTGRAFIHATSSDVRDTELLHVYTSFSQQEVLSASLKKWYSHAHSTAHSVCILSSLFLHRICHNLRHSFAFEFVSSSVVYALKDLHSLLNPLNPKCMHKQQIFWPGGNVSPMSHDLLKWQTEWAICWSLPMAGEAFSY